MLLHSTWLATFALSVAAAATPKARRSDTDRVSTTWYAGWHSEDFPLCEVSWEKYTHVTYAFAVTTPDVHTLSLEGSNGSLLPEFVQTAHEYGTKALISVGGWTGSRFFSTAVASAENRTAFVNTVLDFVKKYDLDGVDFDWEYPAAAGVGCNTFSSNDTANFLSFLQELRATETGKNMVVTAAASISPLIGANGSPSTDLSGFAEVFDWISIMNYDVWGSWMPAVGPNAPLQDACAAKPSEKAGSLASAVDAWHNAGIPFSQLVAAVPAYGHGYRVRKADAFASSNSSSNGQQALTLYPPFVASERPAGDAWSGAAGTDVCGAATPAGDTWTFWGLIEAGWLNAAGEPAEGISSAWDDCAKVPYVYNVTSEVMISYDDPRSFAAKGQFVREKNLRGFSMWEAAGDYDDMLLDAMLTTIGDFDL